MPDQLQARVFELWLGSAAISVSVEAESCEPVSRYAESPHVCPFPCLRSLLPSKASRRADLELLALIVIMPANNQKVQASRAPTDNKSIELISETYANNVYLTGWCLDEKSEERVNTMRLRWYQQLPCVRSVLSSSQCQDVFWPSSETFSPLGRRMLILLLTQLAVHDIKIRSSKKTALDRQTSRNRYFDDNARSALHNHRLLLDALQSNYAVDQVWEQEKRRIHVIVNLDWHRDAILIADAVKLTTNTNVLAPGYIR